MIQMALMTETKRNPRRNGEKRRLPRPAHEQTPIVEMAKASQITQAQLTTMPGCQLSDAAITLITMRVNTNMTVAALARQLGMEKHIAYNVIASPSGQELVAKLARAMLGTAASTGVRTLEKLCSNSDAHVALEAARDIMERAGLGHSQRAAPSTTNAFAFSFGSPNGKTEA
jgi:hypothetical protein